ncbi:MAG: 3-isopropylmalate dehydrogenase [Lachnospiraceae bacterium]|nr:3-isopropylmalate dehydrogenase [Lachnospiraceae bacterium]
MSHTEEKKLQWHSAFHAAIQIELQEEIEFLQFLREFNLTQKPLQIDTLIIKVDAGRKVQKNLGQIFRQYNIVEYKSPTDYLSVNDFYKVMGYLCLYQSDTEKVMEIPPDELTMTLVSNHYPREMIKHLQQQYHAEVKKAFPGIYYVTGLLFPMQILINQKLSKKENIWLSRLRQDLHTEEDMKPLIHAYQGKDKNPLYAAVMDLIVRANQNHFKKGDETMCDALRELFADELEKQAKDGFNNGFNNGFHDGFNGGLLEGKKKQLIQMVCKKLLKGKAPETIADELEEDLDSITSICLTAKAFAPDYDCDKIYEALAAKKA